MRYGEATICAVEPVRYAHAMSYFIRQTEWQRVAGAWQCGAVCSRKKCVRAGSVWCVKVAAVCVVVVWEGACSVAARVVWKVGVQVWRDRQ